MRKAKRSKARTKGGALAASRAYATRQEKAKAELALICLKHGASESELAGLVSKRILAEAKAKATASA